MKSFLKLNSYYIVLLALALLAVSPLKIVSVVGLIFLVASRLPLKFDLFYKLILAYCLFFATNTLLAGVFFVFDVSFSASTVLLLYLGVLVFLPRPKFSKKILSQQINTSLLWKFLLGITVVIFLILPLFSSKDFYIYRFISYGGDNISHLELTKIVDENNGYYYEPVDVGKYKLTVGLSSYPQGLHININLAQEVIKPLIDISPNIRYVAFFYVYCVVMYIIFAFLFFLVIQGFHGPHSRLGIVIGASATLFLFSGFFYSLLALGSQSQIASLVLLLGMLAFLQLMNCADSIKMKQVYATLALILLGGISYTWLLLLPVAGLIVALAILNLFWEPFINRPRDLWIILSSISAVGLISALQPIIQILYSNPKQEGVNEPGNSITPSIYFISAIVLATIFLLIISKLRHAKLWFIALIVPTIFSAAIYAYQYSTVGESRYYFYKSIYAVILIAAIIIVASATNILRKDVDDLEKRSLHLVGCLLVLLTAVITTYNLRNSSDYFVRQKSGAFSSELAVTIGNLTKDPSNGKKIIAVGSCNREFDYGATRLAGVLTNQNETFRHDLLRGMLLPDKESLYESILTYQEVRSPDVIIVSSDISLQNYLKEKLDDGFGSEKFIDLDFGHTPKKPGDCPHLVR